MKLYRKKLNSLEALKREKIRLRYERRHTKSSDLNPLAEVGRSKVSGAAKTGLLGTLMGLANSQNHFQTAITIGKPLLNMLRKHRNKAHEVRYAAGMPHKKSSFLKKMVKEIAVSYIIGKAVQMSAQGIRMYLRRRKIKKVPS